jgi:Flp pilus assembly protein TadG
MNFPRKTRPANRCRGEVGIDQRCAPSSVKAPGKIAAFIKDQDGSYTIESVIWLPIYVFILAIMMNVSMVFFNESQMLRVVQDSNRSFAVGRINTLEAAEQYVRDRLAYLEVTPVVNSQLVDGIIYTDLSVPATQLMPFSMLHKFFAGTNIVVSAQQIVEF